MFRSVTKGDRTPLRQRVIHWLEGAFVAVGILSLLILGFDALMAPGS